MAEVQLLHPALEGASGVPLAEARLSDRERLGVVLQGAALQSHLRQAGLYLSVEWEGARVDERGRLQVESAQPGRGRTTQELLRDLIALLFRSSEGVRGRGEARRAVRLLEAAWVGDLAPLSPDAAVVHVLEASPFLWDPAFETSRRALVSEVSVEGRSRCWVAGPGGFRDRMLARASTREALQALLVSDSARDLWRADSSRGRRGDPEELASSGRFAAALAAWATAPPTDAAGRRAMASALLAAGHAERSLDLLAEDRSAEARALRARALHRLGRLGAARSALAGLEGLELSSLSSEVAFAAAEVASRVLANQLANPNGSESSSIAFWLERARAAAHDERARLRAETLLALSAWDRGDLVAMREILVRSESARDDSEIAWRWHQASGLEALASGDSAAAAREFAAALASGRRRLARFEAGGLWSDLGLGRAGAGDLAGAERAFQHAARLLAACDGPRRTTLALYNLAEIRLRRGRFDGVREVLEASIAENRATQNHRGQVHDLELWARWELAHGRIEAALSLVEQAREILSRRRSDWRRGELAVLAARAHGWSGNQEMAARELDVGAEAVAGLLEPEELPAVWAHAGNANQARHLAGGPETDRDHSERTGLENCWNAALSQREIAEIDWQAVHALEPLRRARLVLDLEIVARGSTPVAARRESAQWWRSVGAIEFAARLEAVDWGPLGQAALSLLSKEGEDNDLFAIALASIDRADVQVAIRERGRERVLVAGCGDRSREHRMTIPSERWKGEIEITGERPIDPPVLLLATCAARLAFAAGREPIRQAELPRVELGDRHANERPESFGILGDSPVLIEALRRLDRIAPDDMPVLVQGESGTGKELAARRIHRGSRRRRAAFVAVNCAALSETLLLSDLFGHARGSFTGADRERLGVFESAQGGSVFLDEIGDLPLVAQGMLLRVLQEGEVRRLGESSPRKVDVRVIAATHRDLSAMVAAGTFRQDLYFRLRVARIELPPLRERGSDITLLAEFFLSRLARSENARGPEALRLSRAARARLLAHNWPGNVRELENTLRVAASLADGGEIEVEHLEIPEGPRGSDAVATYHHAVDVYRRRLVEEALTAARGNRAEAARRLGLTRQALSYLVRQLRLS